MAIKSKSFEITESANAVGDIPSGHWTYVEKISALNGLFVKKQLLPQYSIEEDRCLFWMSEQKYAKEISNRVRNLKNPNYNVPKTFISNGKVYEEFAIGHTITKLSKLKMCPVKKEAAKEKMTIALSHLINDMSELFKTQKNDKTDCIEDLSYEEAFELTRFFSDKIGKKNVELIMGIFNYLANLPENKTLVFVHGDLHHDNIIMDDQNNISFIDFEMSGYITMLSAMYSKSLAKKDLWDLVNKLPRTKNSQLQWNFDEKIQFLYFWILEFFDILFQFRKRIHLQARFIFEDEGMVPLNDKEKDFFKIFETDFIPDLESLFKSVLQNRVTGLKKSIVLSCGYKMKNK